MRTVATARARDSPSIAAASDSEHPTPQTPARRWRTWRRERAGASGACAGGEAQAPHDPGRALALRRMRAPRPAPPPRLARPAAGKVPGASDVSAPTRAAEGRTAAGRGARRRRGPEGAQVERGRGQWDHPEAAVWGGWALGDRLPGLERSGPGEEIEYREFPGNGADRESPLGRPP